MNSDFISQYQAHFDAVVLKFLPAADAHPQILHEAMRYAVLNGGKRIRPLLVYATGLQAGAPIEALDVAAVAVEFIHCYSLVHDDLPCMDNDDLRRGQPTCHKAFDEATAMLAGDALQALAFTILAKTHQLDAETKATVLTLLGEACGANGMAGGQAIDLQAAGKSLTSDELTLMHTMKTGALIRASVLMGAQIAKVNDKDYHSLEEYANDIGLAFQVQDDILDVEADTSLLGKQQGADLLLNKPTFPSVLGMDVAKEKVTALYNEGLDAIANYLFNQDLKTIATYIVKRTY